MKPNYAEMRSRIPNKLRAKAKVSYDVLWQDHLVDKGGNGLHGLTQFDPNQIILDTMQSDKEVIVTLFHEFIHAIASEYEIEMTENEVRKMEKSFLYMREFFLRLEGLE